MVRIQTEAIWEEDADQNILRKVDSSVMTTVCCQRSENRGGRPKLRISRQNTLSRTTVGLNGYKKKQGLYLRSHVSITRLAAIMLTLKSTAFFMRRLCLVIKNQAIFWSV